MAAITVVGFFAPAVVTVAGSAPVKLEAFTRPQYGIRVHPFERFEGGGCLPSLPGPSLLLGPATSSGNASTIRWLDWQISFAMRTCSPVWQGGVTLDVSVDATGTVGPVTFDSDADAWLAGCVSAILRRPRDPNERARGAAMLHAGYVMTTGWDWELARTRKR